MAALVEFTADGLYCPPADIYIDPWNPVEKAVITHAHADHARWGHQYYLAHQDSESILRYRLGDDINMETLSYGETLHINGVELSMHPAGHIIGSAQIRLEYRGEVWVISGDYKLEEDGYCPAFEAVRCHTFITESTFGLPVYHWKKQNEVIDEIHQWWQGNQQLGKSSLLSAYSLGKAQRILSNLDLNIGPVFLHGAIYNTNEVLRKKGHSLPYCQKLTSDIRKTDIQNALVIAPPSATQSTWAKRLKNHSNGIVSGWMAVRGMKRRRAADRGFILSDHADWDGLNRAVKATEAERVYVTHGYTSVFSRWLQEQGYEAYEVKTLYEGETAENDTDSRDIESD
jgi:putative mRNA 3-end processing factor